MKFTEMTYDEFIAYCSDKAIEALKTHNKLDYSYYFAILYVFDEYD